MDDLPLQVALVDDVEVDDPQRADAGGGQVEGRRRAQAAGADQQHAGLLQLLLPFQPDLRHDDVSGIAAHLLRRQLHGFGSQQGRGSASDRRDDADLVPALHAGLLLTFKVANIVLVQVDVHKVAQLAVLGVEVASQAGVALRQSVERLSDSPRLDGDSVLSVGVLPQRRGDDD